LTDQATKISGDNPSESNPWIGYSAVGITLVTMVMSMTMTMVALSEIADHFHVTLRSVAWVVIVQGLTITALMMPMGRLGDIIGRRKVHMAGLAIFIGGTVVTATAPTFGILIGARVVAAIGNSMLQSVGTAIILSLFPASERGKVLGTQGTMVAIGAAIGPIFAGLMLQFFPWEAIFWAILIPMGISAVISYVALDEKVVSQNLGGKKEKFDYIGAILSAGFVVIAVILLNNPFRVAVLSPLIIGGAVSAVALFAIFVRWELSSESPMLNLRLFGNRVLSAASSARLLGFMGGTAAFLLVPIYLIGIRGYEEAVVGAILFLSPIGMAIGSQLSGRLGDKYSTFPFLILGFGMVVATSFGFSTFTATTPMAFVTSVLFLSGLALGFWNTPTNSVIVDSVPRSSLGVVGALTNLLRNVGSVTGQAISTAIIVGVMVTRGFDIPLSEVADDPSATEAFMAGWRVTFLSVVGFSIGALVLSFATRKPTNND